MSSPESQGPILFYDGTCGLCAGTVRWCLDRDRRGRLRYAPLQGSTYAALELADKPADLSTMVLYEEGRSSVRGDAVLLLLRHLGGVWAGAAAVGRLVPRPVRDALYRAVAKRRHAASPGKCRLPTPEESARFLP
jgi:predicted DCC family thiol-disulfide oxidoreductase YuxK